MKKLLCLFLVFLCIPFFAVAENQMPDPVPLLAYDEIPQTPMGIKNYLLLCVDSWDANPKNLGNTDGIVLVTVDEYAGRIVLTSFIRDMLIQRKDGGFNRISRFASQNGHNKAAIEELVDLFGTHFGILIDNYIVVDWSMIKNIIDASGGVDITVTNGEAVRLKDKTAYSRTWTSPELKGAGTYHFNGHGAVIYMRIRSNTSVNGETQDFRRTSRARTVLMSLANGLKDITYDDALKLLDVVVENTLMTNMSAVDLLDALQTAYDLKGSEIEQIRIPFDKTFHPITYVGGACQQIDFVENRVRMHDYLYGSFIVREEE